MYQRPSKVLPRGGVDHEDVGPPERVKEFCPWSRKQPAYVAWFKKRFAGERCQCGCGRPGEERHHEKRGAHKDDRTLVWLSSKCHNPTHQGSRHHKDCPPELVLECRAAAGENWLDYCSALEPL